MKKFVVIVFLCILSNVLNAQNIAINTDASAAHSSSILDVKSTTKGMLIPRMTSVQRTAIVSPATGLMVFDTDTKTIWAYDGTTWKNLVSSGGLVLPFSQTVNTGISAFHVGNQGIGAAIDGSSTAEFGTGITARATGAGGWGLNAITNGAGAKSINAYADNGTAIHGENNNVSNTNTLLSLLNKAAGKTATFQLSNSISTSSNVQIAGNNLGEQLKIFQTNAANTAAAVSIENSGTGEGLYSSSNTGMGVSGISSTGIGVSGSSTSNYGVRGTTNSSTGFSGVYGANTGTAGSGVVGVSNVINTQGVYGTSTSGIGVRGVSNTYRAVQGISTSGTGVYASSTSGLALEAVGNVKISGGNTNPSAGAVLTSDLNGNAVWKKNKIAFKSENSHTNYFVIPDETERKIMFFQEVYDYGNNFEPYTGGTPGLNSATFIAPVNGLYHFDVKIGLEGAIWPNEMEEAYVKLRRQRGNIITDVAKSIGTIQYNWSLVDHADFTISTDVQLQVGDKLWVIIYMDNDLGGDGRLTEYETFSCHLIFED